jgi:hypothetical protein
MMLHLKTESSSTPRVQGTATLGLDDFVPYRKSHQIG